MNKFNADFVLRTGAQRATILPRASISISPSNPSPTAGDTLEYFLTVNGLVSSGEITIAQSGDLVDGDFDVAFYTAIAAAVAVTPGLSFSVDTITIGPTFGGVLRWIREIEGTLDVDAVHTVTLSDPTGVLLAIPSASIVVTPEQELPEPVPGDVFAGVNLASGEFGGKTSVLDTGYTYPGTSTFSIFHARGMPFFRVPVRWNRLQTDLFGPLTAADMTRLDALMAHVASLPGAKLILDVHDYGNWDRSIKINTPGYEGALADFWIKISQRWAAYGDDFRIGFMNEPQSPNGYVTPTSNSWIATEWRDACLYELGLMRTAGVTQHVYIPGCGWTGAHSWISSGNAAAWDAVTPAQQAILDAGPWSFEMHQYLDSDSSGTSPTAIEGAGYARLAEATDWLRARGLTAFLGEFGYANNPQMMIEGEAIIQFMHDNADVWTEFTYWSAGPFWNPNYMYLLGHKGSGNNLIEKEQIRPIVKFTLPIVASTGPTGVALNSTVSTDAGVQGDKVGDLTLLGVVPEDFLIFSNTFVLVNDAGGKYQLFGREVQVGPTARVAGETNQITVRGTNRAGASVDVNFSMPVVAAPTFQVSRISAQAVDEGSAITIRIIAVAPAANTGFDIWVGGGDLVQFEETWESVVRAAVEPMGYTVTAEHPTRMRIRATTGAQAGNMDIVWTTRADFTTETGQYQWNLFADTFVGAVKVGGNLFGYINDTSLTPAWSLSVSPATAYEGDTVTHTLTITTALMGATVVITPSGAAADSDFDTAFDAAVTPLPTGLIYTAGSNTFEVTGAWNRTFSWTRVVTDDLDTSDELYTVTLSSPGGGSQIGVAAGSSLLRQLVDLETAAQDYTDGDLNLTDYDARAGAAQYEKLDGTFLTFAADAPRIGDRGLLIEPALTNIFPNPRGLGGTIGGALPTGMTFGQADVTKTFVARGERYGLPYIRVRIQAPSASGSPGNITLNLNTATDMVAVAGVPYAVTVGLQLVAGSLTGLVSATTLSLKPYTSAGVASGSAGSGLSAYGPILNFATATVTPISPAARLRIIMTFNRNGAGPVDATFDIFCPSVLSGTTEALPLAPAAGAYGPVTKGADIVNILHQPYPEGVFTYEWDAITRNSGEVVWSMWSDISNYIQLEYGDYGYLRLRAAVNGSVVVDLQGSYIVKGERHAASVRYSKNDWALILDGEVVASQASGDVPIIDTLSFAKDAAGVHGCSLYVRGWENRSDQRNNAGLMEDTADPGTPLHPAINLAGAEYGVAPLGEFRKYPTTTSTDYWDSKNFELIRLPFKAENVQATPGGALTSSEMLLFDAVMDEIASNGQLIMPDMHNYAGYKVSSVSTLTWTAGTWTVADFADLWSRIASRYVGHPALWGYDLQNEPSATIENLLLYYQAAINAIRLIDTEAYIVVEGIQAGNAPAWASKSGRMIELVDPADKLIFGAHIYFDSNQSGQYVSAYPNGANPETGVERLAPFKSWLRANGVAGNVGEMGWPGNANWGRVGFNALRAARKWGIVVFGWQAGSAVSTGDALRLEPISGVDRFNLPYYIRNQPQVDPTPTEPVWTDLGKVRSDNPYPSNVWALEKFENAIWAGTGNSSNYSPNVNAGTGDLKYIDLADDTIVTSSYLAAAIGDQQIDKFRVIDGKLLFPGIDPASGGTVYFHRRADDGTWSKHAVGTKEHCFDIFWSETIGRWFAAIGTDNAGDWNIVRTTTDPDGITGWTTTQTSAQVLGPRGYHFFEFNDDLYLSHSSWNGLQMLAVWDGAKFVNSGLTRTTVAPGVPAPTSHYVIRCELNIADKLIYVIGSIRNDSHWHPEKFYVADDGFTNVTAITLETGELVFALKQRSSTAYALTSQDIGGGLYRIRIRSSVAPFTTWTEVTSTDRSTFARSFEEDDGNWYVGLATDWTTANASQDGTGSYTGTIRTDSGTILKWGPP